MSSKSMVCFKGRTKHSDTVLPEDAAKVHHDVLNSCTSLLSSAPLAVRRQRLIHIFYTRRWLLSAVKLAGDLI